MSESESSESRFRFTRSLTGRLIAVGLFLTLGTTAVVYTINGRKTTENQETAQATENKSTDSKPSNADRPAAETASQIPTSKADSATIQTSLTTGDNPASSQDLLKGKSATTPPPIVQPSSTSGSQTLSITAEQDESTSTPPISKSFNASSNQQLLPPDLTNASRGNQLSNADSANQRYGPLPTGSPNQLQAQQSTNTQNLPITNVTMDVDPSKNASNTPPIVRPKSEQTNSAGIDVPQLPGGNQFRLSDESPTQSKALPSWPDDPSDSADTTKSIQSLNPSIPDRTIPSNNAPGVDSAGGQRSVLNDPTRNSAPTFTDRSNPSNSPANPYDGSLRDTPSVLNNQQNNAEASRYPLGNQTQDSDSTYPPANSAFSNSQSRLLPSTTSSPANSLGSSTTFPQANTQNVSTQRNYSGHSTLASHTPGDPRLEGPQTPTIKIEKVAPQEVQLGVAAEFQIVVQNTSQTPAANVIVTDRVPEGAEFVDSNPMPEQTADGSLVWNLGKLDANATKQISLRLRPLRPGEFGSVAEVTFAAQATARTICTQPVLSLKVDSKPTVLIGDEWLLDIVVENKGDGPAKNVYLQESVPDQLEFSGGLRELEYDVGTLAPGQKQKVQLRLTAAKIGQARNEIVAFGDGDLQAFDSVDVQVIAPALRVTADGPTRKYLNREATHLFSVSNYGTAAATNVDLVAKLPAGLKFVKTNNYGQYEPQTHSVHWSMPDLKQGLVGSVELVTTPTEPGEQEIAFTAKADLNQEDSITRSLFVDYTVELFCDIDDVTDPIEVAGETTYQVKVVNQGSQPAVNIRLFVDFPTGLQPLGASGDVQHQVQGQRVTFAPIARLESQQQATVTITARGTQEGDHRVIVSMSSDDRETPIAKEETTRVYFDGRHP